MKRLLEEDALEKLPVDIFDIIVNYLQPLSFLSLRIVCQAFKNLKINKKIIWCFLKRCNACGCGYTHLSYFLGFPCPKNNPLRPPMEVRPGEWYKADTLPVVRLFIRDGIVSFQTKQSRYFSCNWGSGVTVCKNKYLLEEGKIKCLPDDDDSNSEWQEANGVLHSMFLFC
jgi:hypothetical protein